MPLSEFNHEIDTTLLCPESCEYLKGLLSLSEDKLRTENLPKILHWEELFFLINDAGKAEACQNKQQRKLEILEKLIVLEEQHNAEYGLSHQPTKSHTDQADPVTAIVDKNTPAKYSVLGSILNLFRVTPSPNEQLT